MLVSVIIRYKKLDMVFFMLEATVAINCFGRYMVTVATNVDVAVWGTKILYIGGCYIPPLLVMALFKLCNIKVKDSMCAVMLIYSTVVMALVMTVGHSDIYYKSYELVTVNGYGSLDKVYGPLHVLYPVMMMMYACILVGFVGYAFYMRKRIPSKTAIVISVLGIGIICAYILERVLDTHISVMCIGYLLASLFLTRFFDRISMYDMTANIVSAVEERREYSYIVFDKKFRYVSSDEYIKEIFPQIEEWEVDSYVQEDDSLLYREAVKYLKDMKWKEGDKKLISVNDQYYEIQIRPLSHGRKEAGYIIEFVDRTMERKYYNSIENYNAELEKEVEEKTADILHIKDMMVLGMADMVESRDNSTGGHIKRTSAVVRVFANRLKSCKDMNLSEAFLKMVEKAAPMHDLGKIAIDDNILRKPGKFTPEEFNEMKRHTTEGSKIVKNILVGVEDDEFVQIARNVALYHHEKWNGKGYPEGLCGNDIPVEARIMALADVFDALVSKRCYKEGYSYEKAFSIIREELGVHFDPALGEVFLECGDELKKIYDEY